MTAKELKEKLPELDMPIMAWVEENGSWVLRKVIGIEVHDKGGITLDIECKS